MFVIIYFLGKGTTINPECQNINLTYYMIGKNIQRDVRLIYFIYHETDISPVYIFYPKNGLYQVSDNCRNN